MTYYPAATKSLTSSNDSMPNYCAIAVPSVRFQWGMFVVYTTLFLTSPAIPIAPTCGHNSESRSKSAKN